MCAGGGEYLNEETSVLDLSIILPAYNSEKWIKKAIDSVLSQKTSFSFELIVVNDGSTDSTGNIVNEYKDKTNVKIIHQSNKGLSGARNIAIDIAKGKYLMFVDSDDVLLPNAIENLMRCAITKNTDIVCGNYVNLYKNGKTKSVSNYKLEEVKPMGKIYAMPWGKVYSKMLFRNLRFPNGYWFEDSIFPMIIWEVTQSCYTIPETVYEYFINDVGICGKTTKSVKSIDSLYITSSLLKDRSKLGLTNNSDIFNYFLSAMKLTFRRTRNMKSDVRKAIFVIQCELKNKYFSNTVLKTQDRL